MSRAYKLQKATSTSPMILVPRSIYPLIEGSEETNISYYLGCSFAEVCIPSAFAANPLLGSGGLSHLFHARLLTASSTVGSTVDIRCIDNSKVDFVAFDDKLTGIHLIEAKGSGESVSPKVLHRALRQCDSVVDVSISGGPPMYPASLTASVTYVGTKSVACGGFKVKRSVRTAVFDRRSPTWSDQHLVLAPSNPSAISLALQQLFGTKLLGLYLALQAGKKKRELGEWTSFQFAREDGFELDTSIAVPTQLLRSVHRFWADAQEAIKRNPLRRQ